MAQIEGIQRERLPYRQNLQQELRNKDRIFRVIAPLCIVGMAGTGRKTLAHRLANMDEEEFHQEVPLAYFYMPFWEEQFPPEYSHHRYSRFTVQLIIYIIEEPEELPSNNPPLYWEHWNDFCCMVFLFDVKDSATFLGVSVSLTSFRRNQFRIPTFFIVGNKCDRRPEPPEPGKEEVCREAAEVEAEYEGGSYYECSAKKNIDVEPLLMEIKQCAIARRYWIP